MDSKMKKPNIINLNADDRNLLEHKRNVIALKELSRRSGRLHNILPLLPHVKPDLTPKEYIDLLEKRKTQLRKKVADYKEQNKEEIARYERIRSTDYNKARYCDHISRAPNQIFYSITPDQFSSSANRIILGQSGDCQIIHELIGTPSAFHRYLEEGPSQNDSIGGADITEVLYPDGNSIECELELTDQTHLLWVDALDGVYATGLHQYNIPAPACDSLITVYVNFGVGTRIIEHDAEYGYMQVYPILYISPTGATPRYAELFDSRYHLWDYGIKIRVEDGDYDFEYTGFDFSDPNSFAEFRTQYYVKANVTSKIYFGIAADLVAREGNFETRAYAYLTYPPGATTNDPAITPPFWPPKPGVQYISWPEVMTPQCYITTAICSVLGKSDDCYELTLARNFRDSYVKALPDGDKLIAAYYDKAPHILKVIENSKDKRHILLNLYNRFLRTCIHEIEQGQKDKAISTYKNMVSYIESIADAR